MPSTYSDLQSLRPSDVAEHIAAGIEDYDPNYLGPSKGLAYTAGNLTGEPGGHGIDVTAAADDGGKRTFHIRVTATATATATD